MGNLGKILEAIACSYDRHEFAYVLVEAEEIVAVDSTKMRLWDYEFRESVWDLDCNTGRISFVSVA